MLIGLGVRDVLLIETLDLALGPGLTVLTGETGAGKSIILDALGLALGRRSEAGLVRRGAEQGSASAVFAPPAAHPVWTALRDAGLEADPGEDLILRRRLTADGRSRAFINDQPAGVALLRDVGAALLEVHGQHQTLGLLDAATHRALLDGFGALGGEVDAVSAAWEALKAARMRAAALRQAVASEAAEAELLAARLAELDRLDPRVGEEAALAEERAVLSAAEKAVADIAAAREALGGDQPAARPAQALRALERARERTLAAGASTDGAAPRRLAEAIAALERALVELNEAAAALDAAAEAFDFAPDRLERSEERLFALRAAARKLGCAVDDLPAQRAATARALQGIETAEADLAEAEAAARAAEAAYAAAADQLTRARTAVARRLEAAVATELPPLKLDKARFRVALTPVEAERAGPSGLDRVAFEVSTNPGAPFGSLGAIASGGELARLALALKAAMAARRGGAGVDAGEGTGAPVMVFDEVDQGVGGAVADAVGLRLKRLAESAQVLVVTHSPQVAARADAHWRVRKAGDGERVRTVVEVLTPAAREEEIARMLAGAEVTPAARAAARALMEA